MGFVSLMCWKCTYLFEHENRVTPYMYSSGENETIPLSKTLFCDDSSYTCSEIEGSKQLLYKIGMFAAASGMELNIKKIFYVLMGFDIDSIPRLYIPMPEFDLPEYIMATGLYKYVQPIINSPIKEESVHYEWRHLGNFQSNAESSNEFQH